MNDLHAEISIIKEIIIKNNGHIRLIDLFKQLVVIVEELKSEDDARQFILKTLKKYPSIVHFSNSGYLTLEKEFAEIPTKIENGNYLFANVPQEKLLYSNEIKNYEINLGKWLLFVERDNIDDVWQKIKKATESGELGVIAKLVFPNKKEPNKFVICVVTHNWTWKENVMFVRENLRKLGFKNKISYKKDSDTGRKYKYLGDKNISEYYE